MATTLEVFADISCPFTHVGLMLVGQRLEAAADVDVRVRAWPLEWVNGAPLPAAGVGPKIAALEAQLGEGYFHGFDAGHWPDTTIPALNLVAAAYERDTVTGFAASRRLRDLLFLEQQNIADVDVLADVASEFDLEPPATKAGRAVLADYAESQRRGVRGSPDFWIADDEFFCPSLDLGHDDTGNLTASIDLRGLDALFDRVFAASADNG